MNIAVHTTDKTNFPNIALMKISSFYKQLGNNVEWFNALKKYEKVYSSNVFTFSEKDPYLPKGTIFGGSGHSLSEKLPEEIENHNFLDYSLYPKCDFSVQYFSRGCIRNCPFCIVREKEGYIKSVNNFENLNINGNHIKVMDNNFFANPEWKKAYKYLIEQKQKVDMFGVDIRIINEEQIEALNTLKHHKQIKIAWDNPKEDIAPKIKDMLKKIKAYKIMCYVLIGFWSTPEEDMLRISKLKDMGIDPFIMPYNKKDQYQKSFARWVNHKAIFKSVKWSDYK